MQHIPKDAEWRPFDESALPAGTIGLSATGVRLSEKSPRGSIASETVTREMIVARARNRNIDVEYSAFTILAEHRLCREYVLYRDFIADKDITDNRGRKDELNLIVSFLEFSRKKHGDVENNHISNKKSGDAP